MGFLKELFSTGLPDEKELDVYRREIETLRDLIGVGESFLYLGRECVVLAHSVCIPTYPSYTTIPKLVFEYADCNGVIQRSELSYEQALHIVNYVADQVDG